MKLAVILEDIYCLRFVLKKFGILNSYRSESQRFAVDGNTLAWICHPWTVSLVCVGMGTQVDGASEAHEDRQHN